MSVSKDTILVLQGEPPSPSEANAAKLAELMGAEVFRIPAADLLRERGATALASGAALLVNMESLAAAADGAERERQILSAMLDLAPYVFVYGCRASERHASILKTLSAGSLVGVTVPTAGALFRVSNTDRELCRQFSGLSIPGVNPETDGCFVEGKQQSGQSVLIRGENGPFFVRVEAENSELFFVACGEIADIDESISGDAPLLEWFSRVVPLMIFLRTVLGDRAWHADAARACFIVDDPLLKERYGFLEFAKLHQAMKDSGFAASIAFIPWNYRRSRKQTAAMFSTGHGSLSLCVHGCDHTGAEFASNSAELLEQKARLALERMRSHRAISSVAFDEVMVFPQGLFSAEALGALEAAGYLASVNTHPCPSNAAQTLPLRDLLDVAVTRFGGCPLFVRHYPKNVAEFAFDLFLGKPAFIVEHHGYFRNGYANLRAFINQVNGLDAHLEWTNLASICSQACLKKMAPGGELYVRFYTARFHLANTSAHDQTYVLFGPWKTETASRCVRANGMPRDVEDISGRLGVRLTLSPGEAAEIRTGAQGSIHGDSSLKAGATYRAKVFFRRVLCEFRDDYVETSRVLAGMASMARRLRPRRNARIRIPVTELKPEAALRSEGRP